MKRSSHLVGKRVAQVLVALVLLFVVAQSAFAAGACECPACPMQSCMHAGCPNGDDDARCATATSDACRYVTAMPALAAFARLDALHCFAVMATTGTAEAAAAWSVALARHALARPIAAPPAHIAYCRLRR